MDDFKGSIEGKPTDTLAELGKLNDTLAKAIETIRPPEKSLFVITGAAQASHVRFRGYELVVFCKAESATIVLHIGNKTWSFTPQFITPVAGNLPYYNFVVPFPILVDRGIDIYWTGTFDAILSWITYTPE